jgi:putative heme-binding domain-containing protein
MWMALAVLLQAASAGPSTRALDVAQGRVIFRLRCAECHGGDAEGGRAPNLAAGVFYHGGADADLSRTIQNGIPGTEMPGFALSETRLAQIVLFLRSLPRSAAPSELPGDPKRGEALFRGKGNCLSCHRLGREGGFAGPDLTSVGSRRSLDYLRTSLIDPDGDVRPRYRVVTAVDASGGRVRGFLLDEDRHSLQMLDFDGKLRSLRKDSLASYQIDRQSVMQSFAGIFDGKEMDDVVSYLAGLRGEVSR